MSSILTNNGAMVALQTMKSINKNMGQVQQEISTGKSVANAKDNAAVWAITKTMESDVKGFQGISASLALGSSTIAVARAAAEDITELLTSIKDKIVSAQESNVDRNKIQDDVAALRSQIDSIVGAAQFNGLNLLSNRRGGAAFTAVAANTGANNIQGSGQVNILSSLDRSSGGVTSSNISAGKSDLGTQARIAGATTGGMAATAVTGAGAITAAATGTIAIVGDITTAGRVGEKNRFLAGDTYTINGIGGLAAGTVSYVVRDGDSSADVVKALANRAQVELKKANITSVSIDYDLSGASAALKITNNGLAAFTTAAVLTTGGTAGGGLEMLRDIDVSSTAGAASALVAIEGLTQTAIAAAAEFGTVQKRIEVQQSFVSKLTDSLRSGIGSMVDANMEEASARLQALQVQQQLATQSLSIANQAPQSILSLFR